MSLKYLARYRFNESDVAKEDFGLRDFALETGTLNTTEDSVHGTAIDLDGTTSLLSTGQFTSIVDNSDRSFSCWAKTSSVNHCPILCYGELTQPNAFVVYARNTEGYPEFYDYETRVAPTEIESPTGEPVPDDTWTFYAVTVGSGNIYIYVDGILWYSKEMELTTGSTDQLRLGTDALGDYFEGVMLDLRVWDSTIDSTVVEYMHSVGPNFEEDLGTTYVENTLRTTTVAGKLLCRSTYGIQPSTSQLSQSFFALDENAEPQEAARIEHSQTDDISSIDIRVRHTDSDTNTSLERTIEITPETTTFSSIANDITTSVVFSPDGVKLLSEDDEKGCVFFGAGRDFRMRVLDGTFVVQAYSSTMNDYVTKMEVGK